MLNLKVSPKLLIFLPFALMLDTVGLVLICFGIDDCGVSDTVGLVVFGSLQLSEGGGPKIDIKKLQRFLGTTVVEYIPGLGAISFTWTLLVIKILIESNKPAEEQNEEGSTQEQKAEAKPPQNSSK